MTRTVQVNIRKWNGDSYVDHWVDLTTGHANHEEALQSVLQFNPDLSYRLENKYGVPNGMSTGAEYYLLQKTILSGKVTKHEWINVGPFGG